MTSNLMKTEMHRKKKHAIKFKTTVKRGGEGRTEEKEAPKEGNQEGLGEKYLIRASVSFP